MSVCVCVCTLRNFCCLRLVCVNLAMSVSRSVHAHAASSQCMDCITNVTFTSSDVLSLPLHCCYTGGPPYTTLTRPSCGQGRVYVYVYVHMCVHISHFLCACTRSFLSFIGARVNQVYVCSCLHAPLPLLNESLPMCHHFKMYQMCTCFRARHCNRLTCSGESQGCCTSTQGCSMHQQSLGKVRSASNLRGVNLRGVNLRGVNQHTHTWPPCPQKYVMLVRIKCHIQERWSSGM